MNTDIHPALAADLARKGVDLDRTRAVVELLKAHGRNVVEASGADAPRIPGPADGRIIDRTGAASLSVDRAAARERLAALGLPDGLCGRARENGDGLVFDEALLREIGVRLYPKTAYGVLNGGLATSYLDAGKNAEIDAAAFARLRADFDRAASGRRDEPKGATPAFVGADGRPGPSFLLLKMRSLLLRARDYRELTGDRTSEVLPFFQMTSGGTAAKLEAAYREYRKDPLLAPLVDRYGADPTKALGAVQPLLAALTHSREGFPRGVFSRAWGAENAGLPLPGGHGENFRVLAETYRALRERGIRYAYVGNVDNSGYAVDPVSLALTALTGSEGAFEFAWKTAVDVKGGVLVERSGGKLGVADIGQSIAKSDVASAEAAGKPILFNCATGLFDLDWLVPRLESLPDELPIRVSDQDKEAGAYAQAEQNTWDAVALTDKPLIFAVAKERRFIAAKMLLETLLSSPAGAAIDGDPAVSPALKEASARLRSGMRALLAAEYEVEA